MKKLALMAGVCLLVLGNVVAAEAQIAQYDNWRDKPNNSDRMTPGGVIPNPAPMTQERVINQQPPLVRDGIAVHENRNDVVSTGSVGERRHSPRD